MTLKDSIQGLIREEVGSQASLTTARQGVIVENLGNGSASVMVDGKVHILSAPYGAVKGLAVAVLPDDRGDFGVAVPFQPLADQVPFQQSPFFTGGFIRFLGRSTAGAVLQQVGNRNLYVIPNTDFGPSWVFSGGGSFTTDGTHVSLLVVNGSQIGGPPPLRTKARILVYKIGQTLTSVGDFDPSQFIFLAKAELISDIERDAPTGNAVASGLKNINISSVLLESSGKVYWLEEEIKNLADAPSGTPNSIFRLFSSEDGAAPIEEAKWTEFFFARFTGGGPILDRVYVITATFDPILKRMVGIFRTPFPTGLISFIPPATPNRFFLFSPGPSFSPDPSIYGFPIDPLTVPDGPTFVFSDPNFASTPQGLASSQKTKRMVGHLRVTGDFVRVLLQDTAGTIKDVQITNSISQDQNGFVFITFFSARNRIVMKDFTRGFYIDSLFHVRPVRSDDDGATLTVEDDPEKFLEVSPEEADPLVARVGGQVVAV